MSTAQVHHIFPKNYLVSKGIERNDYNNIANFTYLRDDINVKVSDREPATYIAKIMEYNGSFGSDIASLSAMQRNFQDNAIPQLLIGATVEDFQQFMNERRILMAKIVRKYYSTL